MIRFNRVSLQDNGLFLDLIKQKAFCILQKAFLYVSYYFLILFNISSFVRLYALAISIA